MLDLPPFKLAGLRDVQVIGESSLMVTYPLYRLPVTTVVEPQLRLRNFHVVTPLSLSVAD